MTKQSTELKLPSQKDGPESSLSDKQLRQATETAKKRAGIVVPPKLPESTVVRQTKKFRAYDPVALERCADAAV